MANSMEDPIDTDTASRDELVSHIETITKRCTKLENVVTKQDKIISELRDCLGTERTEIQNLTRQHRASIQESSQLKNEIDQIRAHHGIQDSFDSEDSDYDGPISEVDRLRDLVQDLQSTLARERVTNMELDYSTRHVSEERHSLAKNLAVEKMKVLRLTKSQAKIMQLHKIDPSEMDTNLSDIDEDLDDVDLSLPTQHQLREPQSPALDDDTELLMAPVDSAHAKTISLAPSQVSIKKEFSPDVSSTGAPPNRDHSSNDAEDDPEFNFQIKFDPYEEEEDEEEDDGKLRVALVEEQMLNQELKHNYTKSQAQLEQFQIELEKFKQLAGSSYNSRDPSLSPLPDSQRNSTTRSVSNSQRNSNTNSNNNVSNNNNASNNSSGVFGMREAAPSDASELERQIDSLNKRLKDAHKKTDALDRERRNSLAQMSQNMFKKLLDSEQQHYEHIDQMESKIITLEAENETLLDTKFKLVINTSITINDLRGHIKMLSERLRNLKKT